MWAKYFVQVPEWGRVSSTPRCGPSFRSPTCTCPGLGRAAEMGPSRRGWLTAESRGRENLQNHRGVADALISAAGWPAAWGKKMSEGLLEGRGMGGG